mmetsp:Transcript_57803/g.150289  ORF Transcript_57803/g.150289 Transcript_57803/m.150289 type:complete len:321 (-) Transcript_57803:1125-2087(-)
MGSARGAGSSSRSRTRAAGGEAGPSASTSRRRKPLFSWWKLLSWDTSSLSRAISSRPPSACGPCSSPLLRWLRGAARDSLVLWPRPAVRRPQSRTEQRWSVPSAGAIAIAKLDTLVGLDCFPASSSAAAALASLALASCCRLFASRRMPRWHARRTQNLRTRMFSFQCTCLWLSTMAMNVLRSSVDSSTYVRAQVKLGCCRDWSRSTKSSPQTEPERSTAMPRPARPRFSTKSVCGLPNCSSCAYVNVSSDSAMSTTKAGAEEKPATPFCSGFPVCGSGLMPCTNSDRKLTFSIHIAFAVRATSPCKAGLIFSSSFRCCE